MSVLIYTSKITTRNRYVFNLVFNDILGSTCRITQNVEEFKRFEGPKISYAPQPLSDELFFHSGNLLFEKGINEQNIVVVEADGGKVFFGTAKNAALPYDPFACIFYLTSRYEEYLPHIRDKHDRFDPKASLAYQHEFLQIPVVDNWAYKIKALIEQRYPQVGFPIRKFRYISTIDIDYAYAYKEKGLLRSLGGYLYSLVNLNWPEIKDRTKVLLNLENDPFDTHEYQLQLQQQYKFESIYFFLLADYGINDKNLPVQSKKFQSLIKSIADYAQAGIHPSYASSTDPAKLKIEIKRLSTILNAEVTKSRQHYLKLKFPETYRHLIENDIKEDYTMGYGAVMGFRAGTCTPFNFYDLDMEVETGLKLFPFAFTDLTLRNEMKLKPAKVNQAILPIINSIKQVNGTFISLWRNDALSNYGNWKGWKLVYEKMIAEVYKSGQ